MAEVRTLIVVPHTHWDREWYQTFQQFRKRLVQCVDHVLRVLDEDPDFTYFMLDGQTVVIDDYLEIRPEEADHLQTLARAGRILVGPWYIQPDEFLVSGEAIVRNLLLGRQIAAPYGGAMLVGYAPDCFGHIAQMPNIWQGFGIDNTVFWRGADPAQVASEFWWAAPDGTRVRVSFLSGEWGYSNARDLPLNPEDLIRRVERVVTPMLTKATTSSVLLMNGSDHLEPQDGLPAALRVANAQLAQQGWQLVIGTLPQYIANVRAANPTTNTLTGEFRSSHAMHLLPAVLSARMWIKQRNTASEDLLTHVAEPLAAWATTLGAPYPAGFLRSAWRFLLQNQPHDSICGCSIDQVHREMVPRYDQCDQIGEMVIHDALTTIASQIDTSGRVDEGSAAVAVVVINTVAGPRSALAEVATQVAAPLEDLIVIGPDGDPVPHVAIAGESTELLHQTFEKGIVESALAMLDEQGRIGGYHVLGVAFHEPDANGIARIWIGVAQHGQADPGYTEKAIAQLRAMCGRDNVVAFDVTIVESPKVRMSFIARDLPAYGLRTYTVRGRHEHEAAAAPTGLHATSHMMEHHRLRVTIDPLTGTMTMADKFTGILYPGLLGLADGGDVGDLYTYSPPRQDLVVDAFVQPPEITLLESSPVRATVRIAGTLRLPARCAEDRASRAEERVDCSVVHEVSLDVACPYIAVRTTVTNHASDHRLRVLFPSNIQTDYADADGTYMVNRRPIHQSPPAEGWRDWSEDPVDTYPQKRFVAIHDTRSGLAILNRGLPEYEVMPDAEGVTVALTLLRSVGWLSRDDFMTRRGHAGPMLATPEGQMHGTWSFEYAIMPCAVGGWQAEDARVARAAEAFNIPVWTMTTGSHPGRIAPDGSFVSLGSAELIVSAIKWAEDGNGLIARWYNPTDHLLVADLHTAFPVAHATIVRMDETEMQSISEESAQHWRIQTPAGAIISVRLVPLSQ